MQERGLISKPKRRWVKTTDSNHSYRIHPNQLQDYTVTALNQVWIADITLKMWNLNLKMLDNNIL